ncbi:RNA-dependent RNA polymerase [Almendravirus chico]|uniref:RNA-dependent RNA polymerase n=1 Tax=Almendravirus chico TaxID=1972687 RepID=UPI001E281AEB|nr:RNA-dependent RNA polymerase [Almendravirus chico]
MHNSIIPDTFLSTIGSRPEEINFLHTVENNYQILSGYQRYLEINLLIEVMISKEKRLSIKNYDNEYFLEKMVKGNLIRVKTTNFNGYISDEIFYDIDKKILLDKNILLMLKDIITGRMNTLIVLDLNIGNKYSKNFSGILVELFRKGDEMIEQLGNIGFESIALLEPLCVERLSELANATRPRIRNPDTFSKYLDTKMNTGNAKSTKFLKDLREQISKIQNIHDLTVLYGSFRLWGHPYIEYEEGLNKVKKQVRLNKDTIDENYAKLLANDLMKTMLIRHYTKTKVWNVIDNAHNREIPGSIDLINNKWPKLREFRLLEGHWDELEIEAILDIPEDIDDSSIFSDKTHSFDRSEVESFVKRDNNNPIPTKRVLKTYLEKPRINVKEFVNMVDKEGLTYDDLLIGLKAKERELKRFGRFFTLMTWNLRLYFVISEYMIKRDLIKIFPGLTMADGFIDVLKKMLDRTAGQRNFEYENITYANHIDYEKWNNHQRDEAVGPVFSVIDKLYGLKNFFRRTHQFFKDCIVYYPERPDFYGVDGPYYWNGQPGGFEGIRQKGWSLVGVLCLMRESKYSNTKVEILAQGDNQDVFTNYRINTKLNDQELDEELEKIFKNNDNLMKRIKIASEKIGLIINEDETVQSSGFTVYGKVPIYKGNILNLETKKVNRISGVTNDQLPTAANIMSSVNSTALTVCQYDATIKSGVYIHEIFGIMTLNSLKLWNPMGAFGEKIERYNKGDVAKWLYHDQCLGGNTGMALTRMLIRKFPDPITEGLAFYKLMSELIKDDSIRNSFLEMGNPEYKAVGSLSINKLLEDPTSLNIKKGSNISVIIRDQVKRSLIRYSSNIKNKLLRNSLEKSDNHEQYLIDFLTTISPVFPRFLSDFRQASICGYLDSVIGLVQNSKTIRIMFSNEFENTVRELVNKWEREQWIKIRTLRKDKLLRWKCSSTHADKLRNESWQRNIIGATVPHPYEYQRNWINNLRDYIARNEDRDIISCVVPKKVIHSFDHHGGNAPYLGSNTKESSSSLQPWEKEFTNPIFHKASNLRRGINWMIKPDSKLAKSIYNNLKYVTNVDLSEEINSIRKHRTGTAQHRYKTNRQDNGGFCNITPNILSWFVVTSDYMTDLSDVNYDFMFQASLLFSETYGAHVIKEGVDLSSFAMGISCQDCIREIYDLNLESTIIYNPNTISKVFWLGEIIKTNVISNDDMLENLFPNTDNHGSDISYWVGFHQSVASLIKLDRIDDRLKLSDLYSVGVMMKINPVSWHYGFIDGIILCGAFSVVNQLSLNAKNKYKYMVLNKAYRLMRRIVSDSDFISILRLNNISEWLLDASSYVIPSYPPSSANISRSFSSIAVESVLERFDSKNRWLPNINKMIIFQDFDFDQFKLLILIGIQVLRSINTDMNNIGRERVLHKIFIYYNQYKLNKNDHVAYSELLYLLGIRESRIQISTRELKNVVESNDIRRDITDQRVVYMDDEDFRLRAVDTRNMQNQVNSDKLSGKECPFISGIRPYRCATGAHYKMNDILNWLQINPDLAIVGGDGSGGMSSLVLRKFLNVNVIFNSLMEYKEIALKGAQPGKPQAIMKLPLSYKSRCLNLNTCWMEPSDLSEVSCWLNFGKYLDGFKIKNRKLDLLILDMEARTVENYQKIYQLASVFIKRYLSNGGVAILKSYTGIFTETYKELYSIASLGDLYCVNGRFTSNFSTEFYYVFKRGSLLPKPKGITMVKSIEQLNFSLSTEIDEFIRALKIDVGYLYAKIPAQLRENYEAYLMEYLNQLGITPMYSSVFIKLIMVNRVSDGLLGIIYQSCISQSNDQNIISSDQTLIRILCFIISVLYYLSYIREEIILFKRANWLNNNKIDIINDKIGRQFYIYCYTRESPASHRKSIGPIRDNTFINLLLRSLMGCHYTLVYQEDQELANLNMPRFSNNLQELLNI